MRLKLPTPSARRQAHATAAAAAYREWRRACDAVRDTYGWWAGATGVEKPFAFSAYTAALDREEHAAHRYAKLMRRGTGLREAGSAQDLVRWIEADAGAPSS